MLNSLHQPKEIPTNFANIQTPKELALYLDDDVNRLRNSTYLYHYTTLSKAIAMLKGKLWHLGTAEGMNDKLEYGHGDIHRWENLFFSCFMCEDKESIGMWSMYAQPWEKGVKIAIPKTVVRDWIKATKEIIEISTDTYLPTGRRFSVDEYDVSLRLSSVAYCNTDSLQEKKEMERITWSTVSNTNIKNAAYIPDLTGYIKDMAWSYEKEIRIKAEFDNYEKMGRVAIPVTDAVIDAMIITASPLFEGDLLSALETEIKRQVSTEKSIFTDRLKLKSICEDCDYKIRKK